MTRLYLLLARVLLPRAFLAEFETELEHALRARLAHAPAGFGRWAVFIREIADLLATAARERWAASHGSPGRARAGTALQDLRYALRQMRRAPAFAAVVILTLAVGVGLNATVFSGVYALLLRDLPGVREPDRLVHVHRTWPGIELGANSIPHYRDLRERGGELFDGVAAWSFVTLSLGSDAQTEVIVGQMVSANFFDVLGVPTTVGRTFHAEEDEGLEAHPVVVLSHDTWTRRFAGALDVIGRDVIVNGLPFRVVGVAPEGFRGVRAAYAPALWAPLSMQPRLQPGRGDRMENRDSNFMGVVARMRPGAELAAVQAGAGSLLERLTAEHPDTYAGSGIRVVPVAGGGARAAAGGSSARLAWVLTALVGLLLLLACANVANLFLSQADRRRSEMAVRLSIGADRGRIVRQLLTESLVFAAAGGLLGLALAAGAVRALAGLRPPTGLPVDVDLSLNGPVVLYTVGVALGTVVLFGLAPALHASRAPATGVRATARSRLTPTLVVVQVALSVVLLLGAALFARSLWAATRIDLGFDAPRLLTARIDPSLIGYDRESTEAFTRTIAATVAAAPEVTRVSWADLLPLGLSGQSTRIEAPGQDPVPGEPTAVDFARVGPAYFETMGIRVLRGRGITPLDDAGAEPVVVVNETMAERFWPGQDPLGRVVVTQGSERTVVGVARDALYQSLDEGPIAFIYLALAQDFRSSVSLIVRTDGRPTALSTTLRRALLAADPRMPLRDVRTMEDHLGLVLFPSRVAAGALTLFGALGLLLSTLGIHGVVAHAVARRRREIGIRVALGASPDLVVRGVLVPAARLALLGSSLGLLVALPAAGAVRGLVYTPRALDPVAWIGVPLFLALVALAATWAPARRAARIDPASALKAP